MQTEFYIKLTKVARRIFNFSSVHTHTHTQCKIPLTYLSNIQNQIKPRRIIKRIYFEVRVEPNLTHQLEFSDAKSRLQLRLLGAEPYPSRTEFSPRLLQLRFARGRIADGVGFFSFPLSPNCPHTHRSPPHAVPERALTK